MDNIRWLALVVVAAAGALSWVDAIRFGVYASVFNRECDVVQISCFLMKEEAYALGLRYFQLGAVASTVAGLGAAIATAFSVKQLWGIVSVLSMGVLAGFFCGFAATYIFDISGVPNPLL